MKNRLVESRPSVSFFSRRLDREHNITVVVPAGTGEVCPTAQISGNIDSQGGLRNKRQVCNVKTPVGMTFIKKKKNICESEQISAIMESLLSTSLTTSLSLSRLNVKI